MTSPEVTAGWEPLAAACDAVTIDGETVVYAAGQVHVLDAAATLVWQSCDGQVSVPQLANELAASFGAEPDAVLHDVVTTLSALAAKGLLEVPPHVGSAADAVPILVPAPLCSACGPGPAYETHLVVDVGGVAVTVGADRETAAVLEAALGPRALGRRSPTERPSYGVVVPPAATEPGPRAVARLHRGPDVLFRSRDSARVLRALLAQLATHSPPAGGLVLEAVAVGGAGSVALLAVPENRVAFARRAVRSGRRVSDAPSTVVLAERGSVIVGNPWSEIDTGVLDDVAALRGDAPEAGALPWDEYSISELQMSGTPSLIGALGEFGAVLQPAVDARASWDLFVALADRVPRRQR